MVPKPQITIPYEIKCQLKIDLELFPNLSKGIVLRYYKIIFYCVALAVNISYGFKHALHEHTNASGSYMRFVITLSKSITGFMPRLYLFYWGVCWTSGQVIALLQLRDAFDSHTPCFSMKKLRKCDSSSK